MGNGFSYARYHRFRTLLETLVTPKFENATAKDVPRLLNIVNDTQYIRFTGSAMLPTLQDAETLLEVRRRKSLQAIYNGDVVALKNPPAFDKILIRRVVAMAGDDLVSSAGLPPMTVPDKNYWVECDNEPVTEDSREFGPVPEDAMLGRVVAVVNPAHSVVAHLVNSPQAMEEDSMAQLMSADFLRSFLDEYQQYKPYIQRLKPKGEDGQKPKE